ncbi:MAG: tRNA 4-thiouridine(8) synthase ThiI [Deltaproteobacteria bacterium]|nr:tRNA 4-thiouridine(8) synthase ThiI [Deltaproteobacteria bacterium]
MQKLTGICYLSDMRSALVRYHEIALKRGNRAYFVDHLKRNISTALRGLGLKEIRNASSRLLLNFNHDVPAEEVTARLAGVFGIANFSLVERTDTDMSAVGEHVLQALQGQSFDSFRIEARRVDKRFPLTSTDINRELGALVQAHSGARVDLTHPEMTISVEMLPSSAFVSLGRKPGPGGLPVGASGRLVSLISGGIDSPVASYRMMKRGCRLIYVHFHSTPFLDRSSQEKAKTLVDMLTRYQFHSRLYLVPFGEIQRRIVAAVLRPLRVVIYRRMMLRIASVIAAKERARALVTGESLAQVASQTLPNIAVIEEAARLPVLRPLVGMDKQEIIDEAMGIGTFETSVLPDQDCCQLFVPRHPAVKATLRRVREAEAALDLEELTGLGADHVEVERFSFPEA